jgi:hypothetical protein
MPTPDERTARPRGRGNHTLIAALGLLCLLVAARAGAQPRWGRPTTPRAGACFYRDADFEGDYFCAGAGEDIPDLPRGMNDAISSIRMFGDVEVRIFEDGRFEGRSERFDRNIRNLGREGWNDRLSSLRIRGVRDGFERGNDDRRPDDRRPDDRRPDDRGNGAPAPRVDPDVIVRRAYQDLLNREPDAAGLRIYRSHIIDDRWGEAQVRDAVRNSPEFRELNTMTRAKAEAIVARAYRSVLNRDPDPASAAFVDKVLRDKWTEQNVADELRKSPEYRNKKK